MTWGVGKRSVIDILLFGHEMQSKFGELDGRYINLFGTGHESKLGLEGLYLDFL